MYIVKDYYDVRMKISYSMTNRIINHYLCREEVWGKMGLDKSVNNSVIELLELANINSPFTRDLLDDYRQRLVDRLVDGGKIDQEMADYLMG